MDIIFRYIFHKKWALALYMYIMTDTKSGFPKQEIAACSLYIINSLNTKSNELFNWL
jgi:hypothetical protein